MDSIDREILLFLSTRDSVAIGVVSQVGNIPFETLSQHVEKDSYLRRKEFITYFEPIGLPVYLSVTEKRRKALKPFYMNLLDFISNNWLALLSIIIAILAILKNTR